MLNEIVARKKHVVEPNRQTDWRLSVHTSVVKVLLHATMQTLAPADVDNIVRNRGQRITSGLLRSPHKL